MSRRNRDRRATNTLARQATGTAGRPSFIEDERLPLVEIPPGRLEGDPHLVNTTNAYLRTYWLGECTVIVTREFERWHMSIAHHKRDPTWREIAEARYRLLPGDVMVAMILPPIATYANLHRRCYQLVEVRDPFLGNAVEQGQAEAYAEITTQPPSRR